MEPRQEEEPSDDDSGLTPAGYIIPSSWSLDESDELFEDAPFQQFHNIGYVSVSSGSKSGSKFSSMLMMSKVEHKKKIAAQSFRIPVQKASRHTGSFRGAEKSCIGRKQFIFLTKALSTSIPIHPSLSSLKFGDVFHSSIGSIEVPM